MKTFISFAGPHLNFVSVAAYERDDHVLLVAEDARKNPRAVLRPNGTPAVTEISREQWDNRPRDAYDGTVTLAWAFRQVGLPWPGEEAP